MEDQAKDAREAAAQATAVARDAADAALINAQAVINAERAWLTVRIAKAAKVPGGFVVVVKNRGNTPAKLVRLDSASVFVDRDPDLLVISRNYNCPETLPDTMFIVKGFTLRHGYQPEVFIDSQGERAAVNDARKYLMVYGRIQYEDVFPVSQGKNKPVHETCWCFAYDPWDKRFRMSGREEYNRNT